MTDEELIDYCDSHCETEQALFHVDHVNRMLKLAGVKSHGNIIQEFLSLKGEMRNLVKKARERSNSVKFITE